MAWIDGFYTVGIWLALLPFALLPFELWLRKKRGELRWQSVKEMLASASPLVLVALTESLAVAFIFSLYGAASTLAPWSLPVNAWTAFGCVLVVDFLYYWEHRAGHRLRWYWAVGHSVHHSSPQFDQTTGLRVSFTDSFLSPFFYLPAVCLGFAPELVMASLFLILGYQQWLHTETVGRLGFLEGILNTPSAHRVHHGTQPQYLDKNYGAVLMIWDRLFGSYEPEREPVRYGLTEPLNSASPFVVHFAEMARLWRALRAAPTWRDCVGLLWRGPEWRPSLPGEQPAE